MVIGIIISFGDLVVNMIDETPDLLGQAFHQRVGH